MQKPEATLEELTQNGLLNEVKISVQGLDKRFTSAAAEFSFNVLSVAVTEVVKAPIDVPVELLTRFSAVVLYDTTTINLPDELFKKWPGTGGNGPTRSDALKGEVGFDLKSGQLMGPFLLPGKTHDHAGQLPKMELPEESLRITDRRFTHWKKWVKTRIEKDILYLV